MHELIITYSSPFWLTQFIIIVSRGQLRVLYYQIDCNFLSFMFQTSSSHSFVWVEHYSDISSNRLRWKVFSEWSSNHTGVSMSADDFTPSDSISGVVDGCFSSIDVSDSLALIPPGSTNVLAVLNVQQSLTTSLSFSSSSETNKCCFLVKTNRLRFGVLFFILGRLDFFCHSIFFNNDYSTAYKNTIKNFF